MADTSRAGLGNHQIERDTIRKRKQPNNKYLNMVRAPLFLLCAAGAAAFAPQSSLGNSRRTAIRAELGDEVKTAAEKFTEPGRNPNNPALPELKGDYDWDEKFANDPDWITDNVPGKVVLNEVELAAQVSALGKLEEQWRKERLNEEYDDARILGWTGMAETYNGRFAMFFLVVGLLTEYWTGVTIPGQIEEMLRVGGFIGPDF